MATRSPAILEEALGCKPQEAVTAAVIAERIHAAIISGALPAGTPVRQQALASFFGVSRMPVREALSYLQAKGLIGGDRYRSSVVLLPQTEATELTQAMQRIADLSVALAASSNLLNECVQKGRLPKHIEQRALYRLLDNSQFSVGHYST